MKTSILCLLLVMLTFSNLPARAQDVPKACELTSLKKYVSEFYEGFKKVNEGNPTDPAKILAFFKSVADATSFIQANCSGLSFEDDKQVVIGPVTIPAGVYRAKATTAGYLIVHVDAIDGECGVGVRMSTSSLFNLSDGAGKDGAEAVFVSKKCDVLITVENVSKPWQLAFELIRTK